MKQLITAVLLFVCFISTAQLCPITEDFIVYTWNGDRATVRAPNQQAIVYNSVYDAADIGVLNSRFSCSRDVLIQGLEANSEIMSLSIYPRYGATALTIGRIGDGIVPGSANYRVVNGAVESYLVFNSSEVTSRNNRSINLTSIPQSRVATFRLNRYPNVNRQETVDISDYEIQYTVRRGAMLYIHRQIILPVDVSGAQIRVDHARSSTQTIGG